MTTRLPRGSGCEAKVAAASYASSNVSARRTPSWRHMPSKMRSSLASEPVWLEAARWPRLVAPPLRSTSGFRLENCATRSKKARPLRTPSM
jgi:hypothetical protein